MKISLMTQEFSPVACALKALERKLNYVKYTLRGDKYKAWTCTFPIGGHQDVIDSFLKGAKFFPDIEVLVNPAKSEIIDSVVFVPSGWRALRDAISLRRKGQIKRLIAGPTVCDLPHMHDFIIADPAVDTCLVASQWVEEMFAAELAHAGRSANLHIWPVGVDHIFWTPQRLEPHVDFRNALVYVKNSGISQLPMILEVLLEAGKEIKVLHCGSHVPQEYKEALEWSDFVVVSGESETQGLAMAQAWSMNRQTLVYHSNVISKYHRGAHVLGNIESSPSPYLTEDTGMEWRDRSMLSGQIAKMPLLEPRAWIKKNQTNKLAFEALTRFFL